MIKALPKQIKYAYFASIMMTQKSIVVIYGYLVIHIYSIMNNCRVLKYIDIEENM